MGFNGALARIGFLNNETCEFSIKAELENGNIIAVRGYFKDHMIYQVHWGTTQSLLDEDTGINFSIMINKEDFSFAQNYDNVEKLLEK